MAITFVNVGSGTGAAAGASIAASAINATSTNLIVALVTAYETPGSVAVCTGVTDTAGNTYTKAGSEIDGFNTSQKMSCWYAQNITGNASNVVTASFSGIPRFRAIIASQYSGASTTSAYDTQGSRTLEGSTTTTHTTAAATNAVADSVAVGWFVVYDAAYAFSVSGSNNLRAAVSDLYAFVDIITSSTGSQSVTVLTATANKSTNCLWIFSGTASSTPVPVFMNQYRQRVA